MLIEITSSLDDIVRIIDLLVDSLDLHKLGFKFNNHHSGRPSYSPSSLLKLYIFGYINGIHSGRKLEAAAKLLEEFSI